MNSTPQLWIFRILEMDYCLGVSLIGMLLLAFHGFKLFMSDQMVIYIVLVGWTSLGGFQLWITLPCVTARLLQLKCICLSQPWTRTAMYVPDGTQKAIFVDTKLSLLVDVALMSQHPGPPRRLLQVLLLLCVGKLNYTMRSR